MNVRRMRKLSRYHDGELPAAERARVEAWLRESAEARETGAAFERFGRLLRDEPPPPTPSAEAFAADVRRRIRLQAAGGAAPPAGGLFGSRLRWAGGIVALAAVFGMGAWLVKTAILAPPLVSADVEWVETGIPGASTMIYQDDEVGLTVIWLMENAPREQTNGGS